MRVCLSAAAVGGALVAAAAVAPAGPSWPQFRGPTVQGESDVAGLPAVLDAKQNVAWQTPVHGKAWSSPVVAGGKVWLTTATEDGKELSVVRLDAASGKVELDRVLFKVANPQFCHPFNSYASPTPAVAEGRVYVTFGSPGTACLDAATGDTVWERTDFVCNHYRGAGSSPCVDGGRVFLNFDGSDYQYVAALDAATGKTVWRTDRSVDYKDTDPKTSRPRADGDFRKGFSTPRVVKIDGADQLLSVGGKAAYGYDPATGKEVWRLDFLPLGMDVHSPGTTPVVGPDGVAYIPAGSGRSELMAVKLGGTGALGADRVLWRVKKNVPKRPSPLLHDGLLYTIDDDAMAGCYDAATGVEVWKQRVKGKGFSASPVLADGRIYLLGENGATTTLAPGRTFKVLGEGEFPDGFMNGPAVADGAIFVRTKTTVYRIQK